MGYETIQPTRTADRDDPGIWLAGLSFELDNRDDCLGTTVWFATTDAAGESDETDDT